MNIYCNDDLVVMDADQSLKDLLEKKELINQKGIAVAVNNDVISRNNWKDHKLREKDKVLIISATKGG